MVLFNPLSFKLRRYGLAAALAYGLLAALGGSLIAADEDGVPDPTEILQKQFDDAIKQIENLPNVPDEVKKQIAESRKQIENARKQLQAIPQVGGFGGGFGGGVIQIFPGNAQGFNVAPAFGGVNGRLGAIVQTPEPLVANQLRLPENEGLVVTEVMPNSPAAKAGLQKHDILLELDGKKVPSDLTAFQRNLADIKTDTEVNARVLRKGQQETVKGLKLAEANNNLAPPFQALPFGVPGIQIAPAIVPPLPPGVPNPVPFPGGAAGGPIQLQVIGNAIANGGEATAISIANDDFTIKHTSGAMKVVIQGKRENGQVTPSDITIEDGDTKVRAQATQQVPERYLATVNRLLEGIK